MAPKSKKKKQVPNKAVKPDFALFDNPSGIPDSFRTKASVTSTVPEGIEYNPGIDFIAIVRNKKDAESFTVDQSRTITASELTAGKREGIGALAPVIRIFWRAPGKNVAGQDSRGSFARLMRHHIRVSNTAACDLNVIITSAGCLHDEVDVVSFRKTLMPNRVLKKGQTKNLDLLPPEGAYPFRTYDATTGDNFYHVADVLITTPDSPPQDNSRLAKSTLDDYERVWDGESEMLKIQVTTSYTAQEPAKSATMDPDVSAYFVSFTEEFKTTYAINAYTGFGGGKVVDLPAYRDCYSRAIGTGFSREYIPYDVRQSGHKGLGLAYLYDTGSKTTVAYLAMMPAIVSDEICRGKGGGKKDGAVKTTFTDFGSYPPYRNSALESSVNTLFMPQGVGFVLRSAHDVNTATCSLRWTDEYLAFVLWDYVTQQPFFMDNDWSDPPPQNWFTWPASLPEAGVLEAQIYESPVSGVEGAMELGLYHPAAALAGLGTWELILSAVTIVVGAAIDVFKLFV